MKGNTDVVGSNNDGIDLLLCLGIEAYNVAVLNSLDFIIKDSEGGLHIRRYPNHTDTAGKESSDYHPTEKAHFQLEELPTVALHKSLTFVKTLTPCEVGMVLSYVEHESV